MEDGNAPLVDAEPTQSLGRSGEAVPNLAINLGTTQDNDPSQSTAPSADINRYCFHTYLLTFFHSNLLSQNDELGCQ